MILFQKKKDVDGWVLVDGGGYGVSGDGWVTSCAWSIWAPPWDRTAAPGLVAAP